MSTVSSKTKALAAYLGTSVAWGSTFYLYKIALHTFTPIGSGFMRCALGAFTLLLLSARAKAALPKGRMVWFHLWMVSLFASVIPGVLVPLAETKVTSALAGIIAGMIPLMTLLFILVVFREEKVHPHQLVGLVIGLLGLLVVTGVWHGFGKNPWWAVISLLLMITSYGAAFPYIKRYLTPRNLAPLTLATGQQIMSALTLLPLFVLDGMKTSLGAGSLLSVLSLGIFAGGYAFMWNFQTVEVFGSSVASTVEYTAALVAVLAGVLFLDEPLFWYQVVGGVVVLLGAMIGWGQISLPRKAVKH